MTSFDATRALELADNWCVEHDYPGMADMLRAAVAEVERLRKDHQEWLKADRNLLRETLEERDRLAAENAALSSHAQALMVAHGKVVEMNRTLHGERYDEWVGRWESDVVAENEKLRASRDAHMAGCLEAEAELRLARLAVGAARAVAACLDEDLPMALGQLGDLLRALAAYDAPQTADNHDADYWEQSVHEKSGKLLGTTPIKRKP